MAAHHGHGDRQPARDEAMKPRIPKGLLTTLVWFEDVTMDELRTSFRRPAVPDRIIVEYVKQHHAHRAATYLPEHNVVRFTLNKPRVEGRP